MIVRRDESSQEAEMRWLFGVSDISDAPRPMFRDHGPRYLLDTILLVYPFSIDLERSYFT